ncbi:MAG: hypothetical protein IID36_05440 [Planctomycetes bacterium]|nr:hypothetical protein [Planctomycetota bacterium]
MGPIWWEGLADFAKKSLISLLYELADPFRPIPPDHLVDTGLRVVDWTITAWETNVRTLERVI